MNSISPGQASKCESRVHQCVCRNHHCEELTGPTFVTVLLRVTGLYRSGTTIEGRLRSRSEAERTEAGIIGAGGIDDSAAVIEGVGQLLRGSVGEDGGNVGVGVPGGCVFIGDITNHEDDFAFNYGWINLVIDQLGFGPVYTCIIQGTKRDSAGIIRVHNEFLAVAQSYGVSEDSVHGGSADRDEPWFHVGHCVGGRAVVTGGDYDGDAFKDGVEGADPHAVICVRGGR
nr:hypothetical protein Iba_chr11dCG7640 [Ipomoea batatas]